MRLAFSLSDFSQPQNAPFIEYGYAEFLGIYSSTGVYHDGLLMPLVMSKRQLTLGVSISSLQNVRPDAEERIGQSLGFSYR